MTIEQKIKLACTYAGITEAELARRIETTPQNLHQRLKVGKFTAQELERIAAALGSEFILCFKFSDGTTI